MLADFMDQLWELDKRITAFGERIDAVFKSCAACQRLAQIKDVGPKTATAIVAAVSDQHDCKNGGYFSAWLKLVPSQHFSGDKKQRFGISKRGGRHL
jgi:transposase